MSWSDEYNQMKHNWEDGHDYYTDRNPPHTKASHPYTYDPILHWLKPGIPREDIGQKYSGVYSDRMAQWDHSKYQHCYEKHIKEYGYERSCKTMKANNIQEFLRDYFNNPELQLIAVIEYCNWSTGYATFCFIRTDK